MTRYTKTIIAFITAVLAAIPSGLMDHLVHLDMDGSDWMTLLFLVLNVAGVYQLANKPPAGEPSDPAISEVG